MELRHLRYFVAVAEERSFTRAAERLGIKQPPLSTQIKQLEQELGTRLLRRLTRGVELTDAGTLFLEEARGILGHVDRAEREVRRRARGETGHIKIGSAGATYFHPIIPAIIKEFHQKYPNISISPEASNTATLMVRLKLGHIDLAFIRCEHEDQPGVKEFALAQENWVAVVSAEHRLAGRSIVPLRDFSGEPMVMFPRAINPHVYDWLVARFEQAGLKPKITTSAPQLVSVLPMVAAGLGISVIPWSAGRIRVEGVKTLALEKSDQILTEITIAYRSNETSPAVRNFVAVARRLAQPVP